MGFIFRYEASWSNIEAAGCGTQQLFNSKEDLFWRARRRLLNWTVPNDLESHTGNGTKKERKEKIKKRESMASQYCEIWSWPPDLKILDDDPRTLKKQLQINPSVHTIYFNKQQ